MLLGKDGEWKSVDLGLVHSSAAPSIAQLILERLGQAGDVEDKGVSPNFLTRNWPPAFKEWSTKSVRDAFHAPYRSADRRLGIGAFVQDIPLEPSHPSGEAIDKIVADLDTLADMPTLLLWGPSDPVFSDISLRDLQARFPKSDVHRFVGASHLVSEQADVAGAIHEWLAQLHRNTAVDEDPSTETLATKPAWSSLDRRTRDADVAMVEMTPDGAGRSVSFAELDADVRRMAAGLAAHGVQRGDRVALLIPPGIDLTVCLYACWRMGAVVVVVDAGLDARIGPR
jgi:hypothetical protein